VAIPEAATPAFPYPLGLAGEKKFGGNRNIQKSKISALNPLKTLKTAKEIFGKT